MLGYVKARKSEMKYGDYEIYKGVYCSMCNALGKNYGPIGRLLLNYDCTFAALILLALGGSSCTFTRRRCPFNPALKCFFCEEKAETDFCAHASVILAYYKFRDNIGDERFGKKLLSLLALPFVSLMHRKAKRLLPGAEEIISGAMAKQEQTEKEENPGIDKAADPSADALGKLFVSGMGGDESLYRAGYMTGRLIYILDAADDLEKDIKTGSFNPFAKEYKDINNPEVRGRFADEAEMLLNHTHANIIDSFNSLELKRFEPIAENIIYDGLETSMKTVVAKYRETPEKKKSFTVE